MPKIETGPRISDIKFATIIEIRTNISDIKSLLSSEQILLIDFLMYLQRIEVLLANPNVSQKMADRLLEGIKNYLYFIGNHLELNKDVSVFHTRAINLLSNKISAIELAIDSGAEIL